jgi:hypothetical protein
MKETTTTRGFRDAAVAHVGETRHATFGRYHDRDTEAMD